MVNPTYVFSRPNSDKTEIINEFQYMGAIIVKGEIGDHDKLVLVLREVDVVISVLPYPQVLEQLKILEAIKVAEISAIGFWGGRGQSGRIAPLRSIPREEEEYPASHLSGKSPYTSVSANCCGAYFVNYFLRPFEQKQEITVYGSGDAKAVLNYEVDIGILTIKVATDPRTCNRVFIYRPSANVISQLELISLWEKKTGKVFKIVHVPEEEMVSLSPRAHASNVGKSATGYRMGVFSFVKQDDEAVECLLEYPSFEPCLKARGNTMALPHENEAAKL
ncbi:eugenol synthase 1 [Phtheirospermum japonicum]|uniref:Eugenol synthase 1 n=1 Tax=Phtheirospermum japonicum TaxID=374723 RepID=A0A830C884_9LAMI|nr:eugenol synthase 1 [Phtheirospermum japonicum]